MDILTNDENDYSINFNKVELQNIVTEYIEKIFSFIILSFIMMKYSSKSTKYCVIKLNITVRLQVHEIP